MDQIEQYAPPPNPAKLSDSRSTEYVKRYGNSSWELDALNPKVIEDLITDHITSYIDFDLWNDVQEAEGAKEKLLGKLYNNWDAIKNMLKDK